MTFGLLSVLRRRLEREGEILPAGRTAASAVDLPPAGRSPEHHTAVTTGYKPAAPGQCHLGRGCGVPLDHRWVRRVDPGIVVGIEPARVDELATRVPVMVPQVG